MAEDLSVRLKSSMYTGYPTAFAVYSRGALVGYVGRRAEKVWDAISLTGRVVGEYGSRANAATGLAQRAAGASMAHDAMARERIMRIVRGVVTTTIDRMVNGCTGTDVQVTLNAELESFAKTGVIPASWGAD
jgi:hypothetical protein